MVHFPVHSWIRDWLCRQIWETMTGVCVSMSVFRLLMNERNCVCLREGAAHRHRVNYGSSPAISVPCHLDFRADRSCPPLNPYPKPCASIGSQHQHATFSAQSPVHILPDFWYCFLKTEVVGGPKPYLGRALPSRGHRRSRSRQGCWRCRVDADSQTVKTW